MLLVLKNALLSEVLQTEYVLYATTSSERICHQVMINILV